MIDLLDEEVDFKLDTGMSMDDDSAYMEGSIKDFLDKTKDANEKTKEFRINPSKDGYQPSIVARARNSVLQFPVYVSQGIRVDEAHVISKLFERVYTTLVQTVMSQNPVMSEREANNLVFLKKYHTNLQESANTIINKYYEAIDDLDQMMQDSLFYREEVSPNCTVEFRLGTAEPELLKENSRLLNEPLRGFFYLQEAIDRQTTEDKTTRNSASRTTRDVPERILGEKDLESLAKQHKMDDINDLKEAIVADEIQCTIGDRPVQHRDTPNGGVEFYLPRVKESSINRSTGSDTKTNTLTKTHIDDVKVPVVLREADIKKINGMLPYTMEVQFHLKDAKGEVTRLVRYVLGVKTVMHLISIKDLSEDLRDIINGDMKSLRKVRYKSGEISFKDYIFDIGNAKKAALNSVKGNKKWLNTLRRLGEYRKLKGTVFSKSAVVGTAKNAVGGNAFPIPNGTMVLSQPEVVKLMNDTGIDLSTVANAKRLAEALFLIAVVIVDSTAGTMRVLFTDSDNNWDIQSLSSIQSEVNKVDNKKLANELSHMINR